MTKTLEKDGVEYHVVSGLAATPEKVSDYMLSQAQTYIAAQHSDHRQFGFFNQIGVALSFSKVDLDVEAPLDDILEAENTVISVEFDCVDNPKLLSKAENPELFDTRWDEQLFQLLIAGANERTGLDDLDLIFVGDGPEEPVIVARIKRGPINSC